MLELERRLKQLAQEEMNGRQIRNAWVTARQLSKHRNENLNWEHLSQVMKASATFNKYLKAVYGSSDEQWARDEMLRFVRDTLEMFVYVLGSKNLFKPLILDLGTIAFTF
ncbi:hypothetical protein LY76DRAFT_610903 [Colletotrichum caudatum]|nr:hypothetical protein LY76DRAFT_610903 [Colletotrichum caudatum]